MGLYPFLLYLILRIPSSTSDGKTITITYASTTVIHAGATFGAAVPTSSSSSKNSHLGAIIGGVVTSVVALAIVLFLVYFCIRRRKRKDVDGDSNPDRVGPGKHVDLAEDTAPTLITPFHVGTPSSSAPSSMRQFDAGEPTDIRGEMIPRGNPRYPPRTPPPESRYSFEHTPNSSGVYLVAQDRASDHFSTPGDVQSSDVGGFTSAPSQRSPGSRHPLTVTTGSIQSLNSGYGVTEGRSTTERQGKGRYASRRAKGREVSRRYSEGVRSTGAVTSTETLGRGGEDEDEPEQREPSESPPLSPVLVHQDAGRVETPYHEEQQPVEIPPTYDSIPAQVRGEQPAQ